MKANAIILFTRIPVPGETKTRLQPFLTPEECCLLQNAFIKDIYSVLQNLKTDCDIIVCYTPSGNLTDLKALLPDADIFLAQHGHDIGEKMYNAIRQVLEEGCSRCLLIGSDLPLMRAKALDEAFLMLEGNDMVLCPTEDGGYYLIGMKEPCKDIFCLEYGISTVFDKTVAAAELSGKTYAVGACSMDIDEPQDLFELKNRLSKEVPSLCPETRIILKALFRGKEA